MVGVSTKWACMVFVYLAYIQIHIIYTYHLHLHTIFEYTVDIDAKYMGARATHGIGRILVLLVETTYLSHFGMKILILYR